MSSSSVLALSSLVLVARRAAPVASAVTLGEVSKDLYPAAPYGGSQWQTYSRCLFGEAGCGSQSYSCLGFEIGKQSVGLAVTFLYASSPLR